MPAATPLAPHSRLQMKHKAEQPAARLRHVAHQERHLCVHGCGPQVAPPPQVVRVDGLQGEGGNQEEPLSLQLGHGAFCALKALPRLVRDDRMKVKLSTFAANTTQRSAAVKPSARRGPLWHRFYLPSGQLRPLPAQSNTCKIEGSQLNASFRPAPLPGTHVWSTAATTACQQQHSSLQLQKQHWQQRSNADGRAHTPVGQQRQRPHFVAHDDEPEAVLRALEVDGALQPQCVTQLQQWSPVNGDVLLPHTPTDRAINRRPLCTAECVITKNGNCPTPKPRVQGSMLPLSATLSHPQQPSQTLYGMLNRCNFPT